MKCRLDERYLPDWAKEKLEALRAPEQSAGPVMNGIVQFFTLKRRLRAAFILSKGELYLYIYPENLKAKPKLWFWQLKDVAVIGLALLVSVFALAQGVGFTPLVLSALFAFLTIRVDDKSVLDFIRYAALFLFLQQQYFEWRPHDE